MENGNIYSIFLEDGALDNSTSTDILENVIPTETITHESATSESTTKELENIIINFSDAVKLMKKDDELSLSEAMSGILKAKLDDTGN